MRLAVNLLEGIAKALRKLGWNSWNRIVGKGKERGHGGIRSGRRELEDAAIQRR